MKIVVTGATGLIGSRLVSDRLGRGDRVVAVSRDAAQARARLGAGDREGLEVVEWVPRSEGGWQESLDGADAVVHLAGAGVAERRWTERYKKVLVDSRLESTQRVVEALARAARRPPVLLSASAVGYYGDRGDRPVDETAPPGGDFLARLAAAWEERAMAALDIGVRVVLMRTGVVLDPRGGALRQMMRPFALFVGGSLGSGRQYVPWVHWRDVLGLIDLALSDQALRGPMNATSPHPVTNRQLSEALASAMKRPCWLPVPRLALRLALGELGEYLTVSQRVLPQVALGHGYAFLFPDLRPALVSLLATG